MIWPNQATSKPSFVSANAFSQSGIEVVGTKIELANTSGKITTNPAVCAVSAPRTVSAPAESAFRAIDARPWLTTLDARLGAVRVLPQLYLLTLTLDALNLLDREEGGADALARRGARLVPLFRAGELLSAQKTAAKPHG